MDELNSKGWVDRQLMKSAYHAPSLRKFESVLIGLMDTTVNYCRLHTKGLLHRSVFICTFNEYKIAHCLDLPVVLSACQLDHQAGYHSMVIFSSMTRLSRKNTLASRRITLTRPCYLQDFNEEKLRFESNECDILNQHQKSNRSMFVSNVLMNFYYFENLSRRLPQRFSKQKLISFKCCLTC